MLSKLRYNLISAVFNNKPGWKLDADGKIELKDGNPVYINAAGEEMTVGGDTIASLNAEAKTHRVAKEAALEKLKAFEGLDATKAREAIDKLKLIDQSKLIEAGKVDEVKAEITAAFTSQLAERDAKIGTLQGNLDNATKSNAFAQSKFIAERVAVPAEMFQAQFGNNFKVEDGKLVPYDPSGNRVFSKKRAGEIADIDEALEIIVDTYPHKDAILRAPGTTGSGNNGNGGARGTGRYVKRSDFEKLVPAEQAAMAANRDVTIVD